MSEISFRDLEATDIEVRVSRCTEKGVALLLYKDARVDMRLLDEAIGAENWQCHYDVIDGDLFCSVGIRHDLTEEDYEWVWKQDVGTPSNMEGEKGRASDAFKRACFKWGIGRELYTAPFIWVNGNNCKIVKNHQGKFACYDRFSVASLDVKDGRITGVEIRNDNNGKIVFSMKPHVDEAPVQKTIERINHQSYIMRINELVENATEIGINPNGIEERIKAKYEVGMDDLSKLSKEDLTEIGGYLNTIIADQKALNGLA